MSKNHGMMTDMHKLQMHLCDIDGSVFGSLLPRNEVQIPADRNEARKLLAKLADSMKSNKDLKSDVPAGMTFLGQFVDHDITLDATSELGRVINPKTISNVRTPSLDLDCVFGAGPDATPHLYSKKHENYVIYGTKHNPLDLARNCDGVALIGDPRNDENAIVSQIQGLFIRYYNILLHEFESSKSKHNKVKQGHEGPAQTAKRLTRWHYQWIVLHELLPSFVDPDVCNFVLSTLKKHKFPKPFNAHTAPIPVEFSVAAYRFGHGTIQNKYTLSKNCTVGIFQQDDGEFGLPDFGPKDKVFNIDWRFMFHGKDTKVKPQPARPIGTSLAAELFDLPFLNHDDVVMGDLGLEIPVREAVSLAHRNIYRDRFSFELASGQTAAAEMHLTPLDRNEATKNAHLDKIPLWYYCLQEAEEQGKGKLGQVGGRIVATVIMLLLKNDQSSIWHQHDFEPCYGNHGKKFGMGYMAEFVDDNWKKIKHAGDLTCSHDPSRIDKK